MPSAPRLATEAPSSVVIVGGGAAGLAAADMLRREGYEGSLTIVSSDDSPPVDRPNLSKDYLAGTAQEDWVPLRSPDYYGDRKIDLLLRTRVSSLDAKDRKILLGSGKTLEFGALLLATGADPVHLPIEGAGESQLHYLRTFANSEAIIAKAASARGVVVVGASFVGLEVATSLGARGISVDVVAPESQPLERVMRTEVGLFVRKLHEAHGVTFHLGETVSRVSGRAVTLTGGTNLDADFLVLGVGVRPSLALAEQAGLAIDRGISVNEYLETSVAGIFAAGDAARWPDPHTRERIRASIGWSLNARGRWQLRTCLAGVRNLMPCYSSRANTMMSPSITLATLRSGTPPRSMGASIRAIARSAIRKVDGLLLSQPSRVTFRVCGPRQPWKLSYRRKSEKLHDRLRRFRPRALLYSRRLDFFSAGMVSCPCS